MPIDLRRDGPGSRGDRTRLEHISVKKAARRTRPPSDLAHKPFNIVVLDARVLMRDLFARGLRAVNDNCSVHGFACVAELQQVGPLDPRPTAIILCAQGRDAGAVERDLKLLSEVATDTPVVVISEFEDIDHVLAALDCGARGYIPTSVTLDVAREALHLVGAGGTFVPASSLMCSRQSGGDAAAERSPPIFRLTLRQKAVLEALRRGKANKQIAYELNMREGTVKAHVRDIMRRLNVRNRTEVAVLATSGGLNGGDG